MLFWSQTTTSEDIENRQIRPPYDPQQPRYTTDDGSSTKRVQFTRIQIKEEIMKLCFCIMVFYVMFCNSSTMNELFLIRETGIQFAIHFRS